MTRLSVLWHVAARALDIAAHALLTIGACTVAVAIICGCIEAHRARLERRARRGRER